ncbi:MAG TPA: site-specific DNA-methyltransferase, partial [Tepidimicrobium sp.]|nr:site-specific DNA-methyltransferase [Tepidimicrobium sp.]
SRFYKIFYTPKASKKERSANNKVKNNHPTVKSIALMRYLVRLVTPPNGIVLDPFMGSGSTLLAAECEGFDSVGIEIEDSYYEIAEVRLANKDALDV